MTDRAPLAHSPEEQHQSDVVDSVWASGKGLLLVGYLPVVDVAGRWRYPMILRDVATRDLHVMVELCDEGAA